MSDDLITALLEERRGYIVRGLDNRVAGVDAELKRLGYSPKAANRGEIEAAAVDPGERAVAAKPRKAR